MGAHHSEFARFRQAKRHPREACTVEGKDLRRAGLKVTLPRLKILEILERTTTRHMSAENIYKTLLESNEDIGLATVYRVLGARPDDEG